MPSTTYVCPVCGQRGGGLCRQPPTCNSPKHRPALMIPVEPTTPTTPPQGAML
jgi:hypothetical protein